MADIFLSYATKDRERVRPLVEKLEEHGWSVWWDRRIPPGMTWPKVIQQALDKTRAMVVVWTEASVRSEWVEIETAKGRQRGGLVPLKLDHVEPPLQFSLIQSADLVGWDGSVAHVEFRAVVEQLEVTLGAPSRQAGRDSPGGGRDIGDVPERMPPVGAHVELNRPIWIEGGTFQMGSEGHERERPVHEVTVSGFWIQEHPVTNEEYHHEVPFHEYPEGQETHPVTRVSWGEAMQYALSLGGTLPTEAQWEFAARGPGGRTYPWGEADPTCQRAKFVDCKPRGVWPVMSWPDGATPAGVHDLAGNVWEWVYDWYGRYATDDVADPSGPETGTMRVLRGGSCSTYRRCIYSSWRRFNVPTAAEKNIGFRVAWPGGQD